MKKVLFITYLPPIGTIYVNEAFRVAFGMYGEEIEPAVLLMRDSTVALNQDFAPEKFGLLSFQTVHRCIKRYETKVYAVQEDIKLRKIRIGDIWNVELISQADLDSFIKSFQLVVFI